MNQKLIMENWRNFVKQSEGDNGVLFLRENQKIIKTSFDERLSKIKKTNQKDIELFLESWSESVDYTLEQDILEEGAMDIIKQATSTLVALGEKSFKTVLSVCKKVMSFIERFKEKNPKIYTMIKYAVVTVITIGIMYVIARATGMEAVSDAMEQLASFEIPDVKVSEIVRDFTSQGTVDALRRMRDSLQDVIADYISQMMHSDIGWVEDLGLKLRDKFGGAVEQQALGNFWDQGLK